jgi:hypothetical protein
VVPPILSGKFLAANSSRQTLSGKLLAANTAQTYPGYASYRLFFGHTSQPCSLSLNPVPSSHMDTCVYNFATCGLPIAQGQSGTGKGGGRGGVGGGGGSAALQKTTHCMIKQLVLC